MNPFRRITNVRRSPIRRNGNRGRARRRGAVDPEATTSRYPATEHIVRQAAAGCRRQWAVEAGPFVLGALSHEERVRYQAHLSGCQPCRDEVVRLAGVRALLTRPGNQAWVEAAAQAAPPPRTRTVHQRRRGPRVPHRRVAMLSAVVALAAGCLAVAPVVAARRPERETPVVAVMRPVESAEPLYALLTLEPMATGSRISLLCGWSDSAAHTRWRLRLTVTAKDHHSVLIAEWTPTAATVQPISTWTDLGPSRIERVDVRTSANARLLTFPP